MKPQPGTIHEQRVRCGKINCRCAWGELHRAFYRFWREGGRLRKAYVRRAELEHARAACEAWRENNAAVLAMVRGPEGADVRREIRQMIRSAVGQNGDAKRIVRRVLKT